MSSTISVFANLITTYPTWAELSTFLMSPPGGRLRIESSDPNYALIRYVKGQSDLSIPHVRAFRSVVWDKARNIPVSVTPFKSYDGEGLPPNMSDSNCSQYCIQEFVDGVMIGMFWDIYAHTRRIHTRSTLDAGCRYFSQTKTFKQMFDEVNHGLDDYYGDLGNSDMSWTFVLQHPENRIVTTVSVPNLICVQETFIHSNGVVSVKQPQFPVYPSVRPVITYPMRTLAEIQQEITRMNRDTVIPQGLVIKDLSTGESWKIRTEMYNMVRQLRGNSPRRDYLWLNLWRQNRLPEYLKMYPEEHFHANAVVQKWKNVTNSAFHIYTDVFKARSMDRTAIPAKFRPLVYGLHNLYRDTLKPANKSLDWRATMDYMNQRDIAQMLFVVNWDVREAAKAANAPVIPLEPSPTVGTEITEPTTVPMSIDETTVDITPQTA